MSRQKLVENSRQKFYDNLSQHFKDQKDAKPLASSTDVKKTTQGPKAKRPASVSKKPEQT